MGQDETDISPPASGAAATARSTPILHLADASRLLSPAALSQLESEAAAALRHLARSGEVRVRLVADQEMAAAHLKYSNIPGTTDVLTFDLAGGTSAHGEPLDVDLLVCVDEAERQAAARDHALERELLLYILHGVLHCLGFNDHDDADYERMHAEEDRILGAIGIGPVFETNLRGGPPLRGGFPHLPPVPTAEIVAAPAQRPTHLPSQERA